MIVPFLFRIHPQPHRPSLADIAKHILYIRPLIRFQHVKLGSEWHKAHSVLREDVSKYWSLGPGADREREA